ncbi:MAG: glycosyltransferase family 2 protein [Gemmatimonadota bacterium]
MDISVVIPCYNKEAFLEETLASVFAQTLPPREVIVVDDGSTDASVAVAERFLPDIRLLRQDNAGESVARNRGIRTAKHPWVALLDADDVWEPEKLERQAEAFGESAGDAVCVYTDLYHLRSDERQEVEPQPEHDKSPEFAVDMLVEWTVNPSTAVVRRDAALQTPFPEDIRDSEDVVFFVCLRRLGPFLRVPEPLVGYRRGHAQQTRGIRHKYRSVKARYEWFASREDDYSADERDRIRRGLAEQLVAPHDAARWGTREIGLARACRKLYDEIRPNAAERPESFDSVLLPGWTYRLRDRIHRLVDGLAEGGA